jgi:hypothetical protein
MRVGTMINNRQRAIALKRLTIKVEADDPNDFCLACLLEVMLVTW